MILNKSDAWPNHLNVYSFFGKARNKMGNQQNTGNWLFNKLCVWKVSGFAFTSFLFLSQTFINVSIFFRHCPWYRLFSMFSFKFFLGKLARVWQNCTHLRMPGVWPLIANLAGSSHMRNTFDRSVCRNPYFSLLLWHSVNSRGNTLSPIQSRSSDTSLIQTSPSLWFEWNYRNELICSSIKLKMGQNNHKNPGNF